jgi:hypothetical protein
MSFLDPLLGAIAYGAEVTHLGAIGYGAEVRAALSHPDDVAPTCHRARRQDLWRRARIYNCKARLAQLVECKAHNLEVVGSSPTVGINTFVFALIFFCCRDFFVYAADLSVKNYLSSRFFLLLRVIFNTHVW